MNSRPSWLFIIAAAAVIGWLIFQAVPDRPATYGSGQETTDEGAGGDNEEAREPPAEFGPERRARIDEALRQKASRF